MPGRRADGQRTYTYPNTQRAATLWYHDHRMDFTAPQVYRGLFGLHLVRDAEEDALPLPGGDREVPLVIADRAFAADGSFRYPAWTDVQTTPGVEHAVHGRGCRRRDPGQRRALAGAGGGRRALPVPHPERVERPPLRARPEHGTGPDAAKLVQIGSDGGLLAGRSSTTAW